MNLKSSISKHLCTCVGIFLATFTITIIVFSIVIRVYFISRLGKEVSDYDVCDNEVNETRSYDYYFEAKYKANIEFADNIISIKKKVDKLNKEQDVFNKNRFGPVRPTTIIIVIKVHENSAFLKVLLASLKEVVGITNSLLIFCHKYYDNNTNKMIHKVDFTKYMQLFYPYSSQIYPNMFPGSDSKFCTDDFNCSDTCTEAKQECFRSSTLVEQKHFWWWHVNFVFDHLKVTKKHFQPIVFLKENQFVLEDMLFMLKVLLNLMPENCPQCELISFGAQAPELLQYHVSHGTIRIGTWNALLGLGLAFNQTVWKTIKNSSYEFCHFDDYRWDASLNHLSNHRPRGPLVVLISDAPRVLQMNLCDGSIADCTLTRTIEDVQRFAKSVRRALYPRNLIISTEETPGNLTALGEWKDVRDSAFCMYITTSL